ncbi:MAG TPA: phosphatase PAP2 family protein [Labilithrix sp.]|jgi:undecaprenyl-diphosphatase
MGDIDARIFRVLNAAMSGHIVLAIAAALTVIGEGWTLLAFVPLLAFTRTRRFGAAMVGTCVATAVAVFALKSIVQRVRPCNSLADVHARIFAAPSDYSFPSGHAAGSFACATFAAMIVASRSDWGARRWAAAALLLFFAAAIALSRVALGVHFPGDIAAGAALGASFGVFGARLHLRSSDRAQP